MRAINALRPALHYRRDAFTEGLRAAGFKVCDRIDRPEPGDLALVWNRYGAASELADHFERHGGTVLVAENCPFGNDWRPGGWYSLARRHVALTGGEFPDGGPERWDSWGVELVPFRTGGKETLILAQRGIGHPNVRSPDSWAESVARKVGGRVRAHPGNQPAAVSLIDDMRKAREVVTWSSAAAVQALAAGVPVWHAHPAFIGAQASRPLSEFGAEPKRDDAARLTVFRRLAWSIWNLDEVRTGEPIRRLLL